MEGIFQPCPHTQLIELYLNRNWEEPKPRQPPTGWILLCLTSHLVELLEIFTYEHMGYDID